MSDAGRTDTRKRRSVDSCNPNAKRPRVGSIWVWELDSPRACQLIVVLGVTWNDEEWWVETKRLHDDMLESLGGPSTALNDLSRFWEAVTAVRR
jgi:hypothetical protein